jgi:hypothetical protein
MTELRRFTRRKGDKQMAPQTKITLTNLTGVVSIVLAICGSATLLYSAVHENKASQDQVNIMRDGQIKALQAVDEKIIAREEKFEAILLEIRDRQIRMEERQKKQKN